MTAHSPIGGSIAARVLGCPGSVNLVARVPEHLRRTSAYAERGTALHAAMTLLIEDIENKNLLASFAGTTIGTYTVTSTDVETALAPVLAYVDTLLTPEAEYYLERRVEFPTVAGAFGTADFLVRLGIVAHVVDFKFGTGVRVQALRPDGDEDIINAQTMFYAAAARHTLPTFFAGVETIILTILQPSAEHSELASSVAVTHAELDDFVASYRAACAEALAPDARIARGSWCKFCPARPICPAHTAPLLNLAEFAMPGAAALNKQAYLQALAAGLELVDAVKDIGLALRDQAKAALQAGDHVPGFALSAGRATRDWHDETAAMAALIEAGFARDDIVDEAMRSPKQLELRAKARGLKIPPGLVHSHRSGVSLVRAENARVPVPGRDELVRSFSEALQALQGGAPMTKKSKNDPKRARKPEPDPDRKPAPANDNAGANAKAVANDNAVAVAPFAGGAMTSLAALQTALAGVDTAGRSGFMPMLAFKRDGGGVWHYGQKKTVLEEGSTLACNPLSFKWGYICFNDAKKVIGEQLVSVSKPMPDSSQLPSLGFKWNEQWAVNMKCVTGVDAGVEVVYKPTTEGGIAAVKALIDAVRERLNGGQHDGKVVPIVQPGKDSYQHKEHGKIWIPELPVTGWMPLEGPAPVSAPPASSTSEPPRRRRVG